jgi:hypothetical protein
MSKGELDALVCAYVAQAARWDDIPVQHCPLDNEVLR